MVETNSIVSFMNNKQNCIDFVVMNLIPLICIFGTRVLFAFNSEEEQGYCFMVWMDP